MIKIEARLLKAAMEEAEEFNSQVYPPRMCIKNSFCGRMAILKQKNNIMPIEQKPITIETKSL